MGVVHQAEDPGAPIGQGLAETDPDAGSFFALRGVGGDAVVGELTLRFGEPAGLERVVWKKEEGEEGNPNRESALDEEEPGVGISVLLRMSRVSWIRTNASQQVRGHQKDLQRHRQR